MAYVTVMDACLDERHSECGQRENVPVQTGGDIICGGGHCICPCHGAVKQSWYEEVRTSAQKAREARTT